jgi:hypothetical protein
MSGVWLRVVGALALVAGVATSVAAGVVQLVDGTVHTGALSLDGGLLVRGTPSAKVGLNEVLLARFSNQAARNECPPGLVLTNGTRIAGAFTSLTENTVAIEAKALRFAGRDLAWAVYQGFDAALAGQLPAGKTGALLQGGDFFEGKIKSADAKSAKVLNPIFGPRLFGAASREMLAVVLRPVAAQPAAFEVITRDGSHYMAMDLVSRDPGAVILRHPHYDGLRINAADLVEIRAAPWRVIRPAELKPTRAGESYRKTGADGAPLRIGEQEVSGFNLAGGDSAMWRKTIRGGNFFARVAAAKEQRGAEKVVFVAEADGRVLFRSSPVGGDDPPQEIRFAMPPAESIALRVEGGAEGRGVWGDASILLR